MAQQPRLAMAEMVELPVVEAVAVALVLTLSLTAATAAPVAVAKSGCSSSLQCLIPAAGLLTNAH